MKNFYIYNAEGEILRHGICSDEDFNYQKQNDNEFIAEGIVAIENNNLTNQDQILKNNRNILLYQSDWTQIPNNPLTAEKQQEWAVYRQQLRDITNQPGYPFDVVWPTKPE